jgi:hypothetical protein
MDAAFVLKCKECGGRVELEVYGAVPVEAPSEATAPVAEAPAAEVHPVMGIVLPPEPPAAAAPAVAAAQAPAPAPAPVPDPPAPEPEADPPVASCADPWHQSLTPRPDICRSCGANYVGAPLPAPPVDVPA